VPIEKEYKNQLVMNIFGIKAANFALKLFKQ